MIGRVRDQPKNLQRGRPQQIRVFSSKHNPTSRHIIPDYKLRFTKRELLNLTVS